MKVDCRQCRFFAPLSELDEKIRERIMHSKYIEIKWKVI